MELYGTLEYRLGSSIIFRVKIDLSELDGALSKLYIWGKQHFELKVFSVLRVKALDVFSAIGTNNRK
jgi:hypothetical protein